MEETNKIEVEEIDDGLNHNQIASKGKIFLSSILDFTLHMLLLLIVFGFAVGPIISAAGFFDPYKEASESYFSYIKETNLYQFNEDNKPINSKKSAADYVSFLVKTNYFVDNKEFKTLVNGVEEIQTLTIKDTIYYQENEKYINDNLANYFFIYRETTNCDIPSEVKEDLHGYLNKADLYYSDYLNLKDADNRYYFNQDLFKDGHINEYITNKAILDNKNAELLHDYIFLNKSSEEASKVFDKLVLMYHNAVNKGFEELDKYSPTYKIKFNLLVDSEASVYASQIVGLVLAYVVTFTLYYVILPLIIRENRTVGLRFNRLVYTTSNDKKPRARNIIVKDIMLFLTQGISMVFPILFMGNSSMLYTSFHGFRFIYVILFFAALSLTSIIMAAWGKKHQFLCENTANLVVKDTDSLKVSKENEVID